MAEEELQELIHSLKELQIQEQEIKSRQTAIIERIERLSIPTKNNANASSTDTSKGPRDWRVGDKVYINNKITVPSPFRKANKGDRHATIRELKFNAYNDRISIVTDNGQKTWRASNNLDWITRPSTHEE